MAVHDTLNSHTRARTPTPPIAAVVVGDVVISHKKLVSSFRTIIIIAVFYFDSIHCVLCAVFGGSHKHTLTLGLPTTSMNIKEPKDENTTKRASESAYVQWVSGKETKDHGTRQKNKNRTTRIVKGNQKKRYQRMRATKLLEFTVNNKNVFGVCCCLGATA